MDAYEVARRLDDAADQLPCGRMAGTEIDPLSFGADAPGRLGELGRALHAQWIAALAAREREAAWAADVLADTAQRVRAAADRYADTDDRVAQRILSAYDDGVPSRSSVYQTPDRRAGWGQDATS